MAHFTSFTRCSFRFAVIAAMLLGLALMAGLAGAQEGPRIHVVQEGEVLRDIAEQYGVSVQALMAANDIDDATTITAGQELIIPDEGQPAETTPIPRPNQSGATTYVVQPRDTIDTISQRLNIDPAALIEANFTEDENPNLIMAGRVLTIPSNIGPYPIPENVPPAVQAEGLSDGQGGGGGGAGQSYTVQPGDYLERIAMELDVAMESIIYANDLRRPYRLFAGDVLTIPGDAPPFGVVPPAPGQPGGPALQDGQGGGEAESQPLGEGNVARNGETYTVQQGDTLQSIAAQYRVELERILRANPQLVEQIELEPGMELVIP